MAFFSLRPSNENNASERLLKRVSVATDHPPQDGLRKENECIQDRFLKREWVNTLGFALSKHEYEGKCEGGHS